MGVWVGSVPVSARRLLPIVAILTALAAAGLAGCDKATTDPGPGGGTTPANALPTTASPPAATSGATDWCTLAERIDTDSGVMVDKHFIPALEETLDQLKAVVNRSLAVKDQLLTGLPPDVKAALEVQLQYFQALKDNDFSTSTPLPAGFVAALKIVNGFETSVCGFVYDK